MSELFRLRFSVDKELLQEQISGFIKSSSSIYFENSELANTSHRNILPVIDYLDRVKITKRVRYKLI